MYVHLTTPSLKIRQLLNTAVGISLPDREGSLPDCYTDTRPDISIAGSGACCCGCSTFDLADGWVYNTVRSTCIKVFHDLSTRAAAQAKCETWGANLAVWDSQAALNFWQNLVQTDSGQSSLS